MKILFLSDFLPNAELVLDSSFSDLLTEANYVVFNLEGSPLIGDKRDRKNQIMPFCPKVLLHFLNKFGKAKFVLALANNHILDNGIEGFDHLINILDSENIKYFGTLDRPSINIENKVNLLNFVTGETVARYGSRKRLNYLFYSVKHISNQIRDMEKAPGIPIIYPHWGRDMDSKVFKTYRFHTPATNHLIFGHHPHVISGISDRGVYSMGNTYIPHPYYYVQYPAVKYGLAIEFNVDISNYRLFETEVSVPLDSNSKWTLSCKPFEGLRPEIMQHGEGFNMMKRAFLNIFSFKGNIFDWFKLWFLQMMLTFFRIKLKLNG